MELADYPVESIPFTGLGAQATTTSAAAEALATAINAWLLRRASIAYCDLPS